MTELLKTAITRKWSGNEGKKYSSYICSKKLITTFTIQEVDEYLVANQHDGYETLQLSLYIIMKDLHKKITTANVTLTIE